ncbi:MFS transporter [Comamonas kerstersii]|uniref:MFS transporter n=1 Tax=Comamonas kerstersii TaxID=225992 RepID=A0A6A1R0N8_9BURK|nr:MFS transporter [Comamonas kerstersii]
MAAMHHTPSSQFALLRQQRFGPFFATQLLGAANDNLFKFALTVLVTYQLQVAWLPASIAGLVIGALFILPFVLLSATAGQLADRMDKVVLMRRVKDCEIAIMAVALLGFWQQWPVVLMLCLVGMGVHSTFFGPAKFAYLPQVLKPSELTGGNGMVKMGTFVAILLGNVVGGLLIATPEVGRWHVALTCLLLAMLGRWAAQGIPRQAVPAHAAPLGWNSWRETAANLRLARTDGRVFRALLGISWMWFFGAVFLAEFPVLTKEVLQGNERVAACLLVVFSLGVGTGALLCEILSRGRIEPGLVPLGALGMTLFAVDFWWSLAHLPRAAQMLDLWSFVQAPQRWRVLLDLFGLALSAGIYSVPLYALIQQRSPVTHRARIIAANNILNALFMVASALIAAGLLAAGLSVPQLFLCMGLANAVALVLMCWREPLYVRRSTYWLLRSLRRRNSKPT